jgi:CO/xanthine dehydrogenase Mo-binding subunit
VLTAADVPGTASFGQIQRDYPIFATDAIRSRGDVVALVVAESRAEAIAAVPFVRVDAEPLPPLLDPEAALADGAPLVHPDKGTNVVNHHKIRRGDAGAALARAHLVIAEEFRTQRVEHAYLEPEAALCVPRPDGVLEVYGSMQHPFSTRRFVAALLGVPLADVEVRSVPMGGGFGGKDDTAAAVCARAALAARLTGRPVRITYDRAQSMRESYKRHPYRMRYEVGFAADGRLAAARIRTLADAGAYCSVTPWVTWRSTVQCCGPYRVPDVLCDVRGVHTNDVFTGAMRGFGSPQVNFAVEQLMDMAADRLGLSPVEIRRRNLLRPGDETVTGQRLGEHAAGLPRVLDAVLGASGFEEKLGRCARGAGATRYGIGLALSYRGMSLGAEGTDFNTAIVNVQADGSILLETGIHENGQGAESATVLLLAEALGVDRARIRYRMPSTANVPDGGTTVASRGTLMGGGAVIDAAAKLKAQLAPIAAARLGCAPSDVVFAGDALRDARTGAALAFDAAIREAFARQEHPYAVGTFRAPKVSWDEETGRGDAYFTWVYGAQVAELEVDAGTGKVRLLHAWAAHDVGRAINPALLRGQLYGGMAMGIGYGLHEEVVCRDGAVETLNFDRYEIPRAKDVPEMTAIVVETPDPLSPSGAKGIGEPANELMAPAIANALARATGRRFLTLPMRVEAER